MARCNPGRPLRTRFRKVALAAALSLLATSAIGQESIVKAEELIGLQMLPLSRPTSFEAQHLEEELDYIAWLLLRDIDRSASWNPRNLAWDVYRINVRHDLELKLRRRWQTAGGIIRSMAQNPDTALPKFLADHMSVQEMDEAVQFFRSDAGKRYVAYLRELKRVYFRGALELDRIAIDPAYGKPTDSISARRQAWLDHKGITLDGTQPAYEFHVQAMRALFPATSAAELVLALLTGAPPSTQAFQRLDASMSATEREAVARFMSSPPYERQLAAHKAWRSAISTRPEIIPLLLGDLRALADSVDQWKKVRVDPNSVPRSISEIDPASVPITENYDLVDIDAADMPETVRSCLPTISDRTLQHVRDNPRGGSYRQVVTALSVPQAKHVFVFHRGAGACVPVTAPGYPVLATSAFVGTIDFVGVSDEDERRIFRTIAQELAARGASESLFILTNGNAFQITYAVNVQSPYMLLYSGRVLFSGTYDPDKYRHVERMSGIKSFTAIAYGSPTGIAVHHKPIITSAADVRKDRERRARESSAAR